MQLIISFPNYSIIRRTNPFNTGEELHKIIHGIHGEMGKQVRIIIGSKEIYPDQKRLEVKNFKELVIQVRQRMLGGMNSSRKEKEYKESI